MKSNKSLLFLFPLLFAKIAYSQTTTYHQVWNEIQFTRAFNDRLSGEFDISNTFSDTPQENRVLKTSIQRAARVWLHFQYSPRWKFSSFLAYFYNKNVPEIGQYASPEWRLSPQGTYYFHRIGYTLTTRMRAEIRWMRNEAGTFENNFRYRQQFKYLKPLNSKILREKVIYLLTAEELFLRPEIKTKGVDFFDRNRFTVGAGYLLTEDIQIELVYVNEFLPRDAGDQMYHNLSFTFTFNNLFANMKNRFFKVTGPSETEN